MPAGLRQMRNAARFEATPASIRRGAPALGEHTEEVLAEIGYTPAEIAGLRADGIVAMSDTDRKFAGSIPALYDRYLGPLIFEPYAADLAARVAELAPARVLETAAGTGIVTRALARALPATAEIVATDLNQPMLDFNAAQPGVERVVFRQADAQELPFPDASFDAVVCQFGAMFFPDKGERLPRSKAGLETGRAVPVQRLGPHLGQ